VASFPVIEAGWRPLSFRRPEDNGRSLLGAVHAASNGGRRGEKKGVGGGPSGRCLPTPLFSPAPEVLPVSEHGQENLQNPLPARPKEQKENIFSFRRRSRRNEKSSSCRTTACSCPTTGRGRSSALRNLSQAVYGLAHRAPDDFGTHPTSGTNLTEFSNCGITGVVIRLTTKGVFSGGPF